MRSLAHLRKTLPVIGASAATLDYGAMRFTAEQRLAAAMEVERAAAIEAVASEKSLREEAAKAAALGCG